MRKKHGLKSDVVPVEENTKHYTTPLGNSLGDVNELHSVFKNEVRKYHGISTRHLQGYLDWLSYVKGLHYTYERDKMAAVIYDDLLTVHTCIRTKDICTAEQPVSLKEAYSEYGYGIFSGDKCSLM